MIQILFCWLKNIFFICKGKNDRYKKGASFCSPETPNSSRLDDKFLLNNMHGAVSH